MGSMDFRTEQRQTQTLSPRLQHAVRLLQLSSLEFAQQVHDALGKNPFLEEDGNPDDQGDEGLSPEQAAEAQEAREAQEAAAETMAAPEGDLPGEGDRDMWQADGLGSGKRADDDETSALDMMAVPDLARHAPARPARRAAADAARPGAGQGDRRVAGRRRLPAHRPAGDDRRSPTSTRPPTLEEMQIALKRVQALEPAGVAARSVSECLLAQLSSIEDEDAREIARHIISEHLNCLAAKDVSTHGARAGPHAGRDRSRLRPHPPARPAAGLALRLDAAAVRDPRRHRAQGARPVERAAEPGHHPEGAPEPGLRRAVPAPSPRRRTPRWPRTCRRPSWTMRNVEQRFSTILERGRGHRVAPEALPRVRRDGDEAAGPARDRRRAGPARVDRVARDEQQVHGHADRRVRAEVLLLARDDHAPAAAPARAPRSAA